MTARELLAICFVLFGALLVWPLLSIPNRLVLIAGVPALVLYLFALWAAIVGVLAVRVAPTRFGERRVTVPIHSQTTTRGEPWLRRR